MVTLDMLPLLILHFIKWINYSLLKQKKKRIFSKAGWNFDYKKMSFQRYA